MRYIWWNNKLMEIGNYIQSNKEQRQTDRKIGNIIINGDQVIEKWMDRNFAKIAPHPHKNLNYSFIIFILYLLILCFMFNYSLLLLLVIIMIFIHLFILYDVFIYL